MHRIRVDMLEMAVDGANGRGAGSVLEIGDEEAIHIARVRRARPGEPCQLMNGRGLVVDGVIQGVIDRRKHGCSVTVRVQSGRTAAPARPAIEVFSAIPDAGRLEMMIDLLSQVGAAAWRPLMCTRSAHDVAAIRFERLRRIAWEAAKQCGRAHVLDIGGESGVAAFGDVLKGGLTEGQRVYVADATGARIAAAGLSEVKDRACLMIGPEGGWTADELTAVRASGAGVVCLGPHILRVEAAAVVGAAMMIQDMRTGGSTG